MNAYPMYDPSITEVHHAQKLDMPSGTAITLAEHIMLGSERKNHWQMATPIATPETLSITSVREGQVPGTHTVRWSGPYDSITLTHEAHSRHGFAAGALMAAQWLRSKSGVFSMRDVVGDIQIS